MLPAPAARRVNVGAASSSRWRAACANLPCRRPCCTTCWTPSNRTCATRPMPTAPSCWTTAAAPPTRGRHYVPETDRLAHGIGIDDLRQCADSPRARRLVQSLCRWSLTLMNDGAPLALRVPGRAGWELRLVVQGGLRILEKIDRMDHAALTQRPKLTAMDAPLLLWRALRMSGHRA